MVTKAEIARRTTAALAAIKQQAGKPGSASSLFASHHLEELSPTYWRKYARAARPSQSRVLDLLQLRSHWGEDDEDGIDVFDFTLPGDATDYVLSVGFDEDGAVDNVSMES